MGAKKPQGRGDYRDGMVGLDYHLVKLHTARSRQGVTCTCSLIVFQVDVFTKRGLSTEDANIFVTTVK